MLTLSWSINLNHLPVHGIQNENLLHVLPFHDCSFSRHEDHYNLNNLSGCVSKNDF